MTDVCLPTASFGPITRAMLAEYAEASGDHNPLHLDDEVARRAGHREVIAQGMLVMAFVGRWVTSWCSVGGLQSLSSRFTAATPVGSHVTCKGHVSDQSEGSVTISYTVTIDSTDAVVIRGTVVVSEGAVKPSVPGVGAVDCAGSSGGE